MQRGDVVVVNLHYRLGALGHVHLKHALGEDFKDAANAGSKDQTAALQWVRDSIEAFGGDPDNVTVAGQSAGACVLSPTGAPISGSWCTSRRKITRSVPSDSTISTALPDVQHTSVSAFTSAEVLM